MIQSKELQDDAQPNAKVMNIYFETSMCYGHTGLGKIMRKQGGNVDNGFAIFINRDWSALKMLTPNHVLLHYKSPKRSMPINPHTIKYLPNCVNGGTLDYHKALEAAVLKEFARLKQ